MAGLIWRGATGASLVLAALVSSAAVARAQPPCPLRSALLEELTDAPTPLEVVSAWELLDPACGPAWSRRSVIMGRVRGAGGPPTYARALARDETHLIVHVDHPPDYDGSVSADAVWLLERDGATWRLVDVVGYAERTSVASNRVVVDSRGYGTDVGYVERHRVWIEGGAFRQVRWRVSGFECGVFVHACVSWNTVRRATARGSVAVTTARLTLGYPGGGPSVRVAAERYRGQPTPEARGRLNLSPCEALRLAAPRLRRTPAGREGLEALRSSFFREGELCVPQPCDEATASAVFPSGGR